MSMPRNNEEKIQKWQSERACKCKHGYRDHYKIEDDLTICPGGNRCFACACRKYREADVLDYCKWL